MRRPGGRGGDAGGGATVTSMRASTARLHHRHGVVDATRWRPDRRCRLANVTSACSRAHGHRDHDDRHARQLRLRGLVPRYSVQFVGRRISRRRRTRRTTRSTATPRSRRAHRRRDAGASGARDWTRASTGPVTVCGTAFTDANGDGLQTGDAVLRVTVRCSRAGWCCTRGHRRLGIHCFTLSPGPTPSSS
jgi:hypothetical protein